MTITVRADELIKVMNEVFSEVQHSGAEGIELSIKDNQLSVATIECGGLGCCADFDVVQGLTKEQILDIT